MSCIAPLPSPRPSLAAARAALLEAAAPGTAERLASDPALDGALRAGLDRTCKAWPWYTPAESLLVLLGCGLDAEEASADGLAQRHWEDLALLDGFRRGLSEAASLIDGVIGQRAIAALVGLGAPRHEADDVVQDRLCRLLGPASEVGYGGRGHFVGWLRRCAVHDWFSLRRRANSQALDEVDLDSDEGLAQALEPEVSSLAARFRPHFRAALDAAVAELDPADRRLLRLVHVDGLTARQVGAVLGLHRVSVQRRLGAVRDGLRAAVLAQLDARFHLGTEAASSVLHALAGRIDLTLSRLLAPPSTAP